MISFSMQSWLTAEVVSVGFGINQNVTFRTLIFRNQLSLGVNKGFRKNVNYKPDFENGIIYIQGVEVKEIQDGA